MLEYHAGNYSTAIERMNAAIGAGRDDLRHWLTRFRQEQAQIEERRVAEERARRAEAAHRETALVTAYSKPIETFINSRGSDAAQRVAAALDTLSFPASPSEQPDGKNAKGNTLASITGNLQALFESAAVTVSPYRDAVKAVEPIEDAKKFKSIYQTFVLGMWSDLRAALDAFPKAMVASDPVATSAVESHLQSVDQWAERLDSDTRQHFEEKLSGLVGEKIPHWLFRREIEK
jgi:hypothetical protein